MQNILPQRRECGWPSSRRVKDRRTVYEADRSANQHRQRYRSWLRLTHQSDYSKSCQCPIHSLVPIPSRVRVLTALARRRSQTFTFDDPSRNKLVADRIKLVRLGQDDDDRDAASIIDMDSAPKGSNFRPCGGLTCCGSRRLKTMVGQSPHNSDMSD